MITLTTAVEEAVNSESHEYCHLVEIMFNGSTVRLTEAAHDIELGPSTFLGNGLLVEVSDIRATSELRINEINIIFSLAEQSILALILGNNQIGSEVRILRAYTSNGVVIPDPVLIYFGRVSGFTTDTSLTSADVQLKVAGPFADWESKSGRRTTDSSQQKDYPGDRGMQFASIIQPELVWGGQ